MPVRCKRLPYSRFQIGMKDTKKWGCVKRVCHQVIRTPGTVSVVLSEQGRLWRCRVVAPRCLRNVLGIGTEFQREQVTRFATGHSETLRFPRQTPGAKKPNFKTPSVKPEYCISAKTPGTSAHPIGQRLGSPIDAPCR
jgi:hypothetical protein